MTSIWGVPAAFLSTGQSILPPQKPLSYNQSKEQFISRLKRLFWQNMRLKRTLLWRWTNHACRKQILQWEGEIGAHPGCISPPRTRGSTGVKTDEQRWVPLIVPPFDVSGYFRDMTHCVHWKKIICIDFFYFFLKFPVSLPEKFFSRMIFFIRDG